MIFPIQSRGFTLIELLVVIAIIGVLSSVVLASLGSARSKSSNSSAKSQLASMRSQAELYYSANTNSYNGICGSTAVNNVLPLGAMLTAVARISPSTVATTLGTAGAYNVTTCHEAPAGWMVETPLSDSASGAPSMWCVDASGIAKRTTANVGANAVACP